MLALVLSTVSIAADGRAAPGLAAAIMRDKDVSACAQQIDKANQPYVSGAFDFRSVRLRSGEHMVVAIATDPCLALGQSTRIMIYERVAQGYRRVLNSVTLPGFARIAPDGTVTLPTHESMEVMFEATYLWNGANYVFSPRRSHRYDVALGKRRPYEIPVRLIRGAPGTTISGTVAYNFGDNYVLEATAGETLTIELVKNVARSARVALYYQDEISSVAELDARERWSGRVRKSGTYRLLVLVSDESYGGRSSSYVIRLSLR